MLNHQEVEEGYQEAAKIDTIINELISKYPPEKHPFFWRTFCRTVKTSTTIIQNLINETE